MGETRELSPAEIKELALEGCVDIFKNTHRKASKKRVTDFRAGLEEKSLQEINKIAEKLVESVNREPKQIK